MVRQPLAAEQVRARQAASRSISLFQGENMTTRRDFIKTTVIAGIGGAALGHAGVAEAAAPSAGPHQMPRGLTLLSMVQADGSETLGVKLPNGIFNVAQADKTLKIEA